MNLQKLTSGLRRDAFFSPVFTHRVHKTWQYSDGVRETMLMSRSSWVVVLHGLRQAEIVAHFKDAV